MRKQYHLRPSPSGLLAWAVDRLIALTADLPHEEVPLADIRELDQPFWFLGDAAVPTCREVADHARLIADTDLVDVDPEPDFIGVDEESLPYEESSA